MTVRKCICVLRLVTAPAICALVLGSSPVLAGTVTGTVEWVTARATDGLTYVAISGDPTGKPTCATEGFWVIMDENSEAGKKQYAMLLLAAASGQKVTIYGSNTCTRWSDAEDIMSIEIAP